MPGSPAGALLGAVGGGWFAQHYSWREGFFAMGAPGLVLTLIVLAMLKEPARGLVEGGGPHAAPAASFSVVLAHIWRTPALRLVMIGGTLAQFGMTAIAQFMAPFFAALITCRRRDSRLCLVSAALTLGLLVGALGTDKAGQKDRRWSAWGPAIGLACAAPLYVIAFNQPTVTRSVIFLLAGGASLLCYYGPALGMIQNMVGPNMRATAASIYAVSYGLLGLGLGPTFAGFLSEAFARRTFTLASSRCCKGGGAAPGSAPVLLQACASASADGLQGSLTCIMAVFALAALVFLLAARSYRQDIYRPEDPSQSR
jgi:MFS family permease